MLSREIFHTVIKRCTGSKIFGSAWIRIRKFPIRPDLGPCTIRSESNVWSTRMVERTLSRACPYIAKLASKFLATPDNSVYSERLFSEYGNNIFYQRNRLPPQSVTGQTEWRNLNASQCSESVWYFWIAFAFNVSRCSESTWYINNFRAPPGSRTLTFAVHFAEWIWFKSNELNHDLNQQ